MIYNSPEHVEYWTIYWQDLADFNQACADATQAYTPPGEPQE
jgi:hypothetical protein